jgi:CelD/BcsL family acetyltransferase involved in cellulose biosynthesis
VQVSVCTASDPPRRSQAVAEASSVETVTDAARFDVLEGEWNDAVVRAGMTHPFLRHEWLRTWWECFGGDRRLHIVIVRSGGRIAAIAPLMVETAWMCGVRVRRLRLMQNDHTPRADFIVAGRDGQAYRAIWNALAETSERWDVLLLGQLPRDSRTGTVLSALAEGSGSIGVWRSSDSPYVELHGAWDAYVAGLPGKFRQNLRNRISRLRRIGEPALESIDGGAALDTAFDDSVRLESSGWKRRAGTAIASDPAVHRFYRLVAKRTAARGWLRLMFLTVGGRRIATSYSLCYDRRLFLCKTGYDPTYESCSPFKVLTYFALRQAFEEGLEEVDFLGDTEPWKREWTETVRSHDWVFLFSNTRRAQLVYALKFRLIPVLKRSGMWRTALPVRSQV